MKTALSFLIIFLVSGVVLLTTGFFLSQALADENATWRIAQRAWQHWEVPSGFAVPAIFQNIPNAEARTAGGLQISSPGSMQPRGPSAGLN